MWKKGIRNQEETYQGKEYVHYVDCGKAVYSDKNISVVVGEEHGQLRSVEGRD